MFLVKLFVQLVVKVPMKELTPVLLLLLVRLRVRKRFFLANSLKTFGCQLVNSDQPLEYLIPTSI